MTIPLTDLHPAWIYHQPATRSEPAIVGVRFDCPTCKATTIRILFKIPLGDPGHWQPSGNTWTRVEPSPPSAPTTFENLTLTPSIDARPGHWHGHVKAGQVSTDHAGACLPA